METIDIETKAKPKKKPKHKHHRICKDSTFSKENPFVEYPMVDASHSPVKPTKPLL